MRKQLALSPAPFIILKTNLMSNCLKYYSIVGLVFGCISFSSGQDIFTAQQQEIIEAIQELSATTAPDGKGADAYGSLLADDFSRWTIGSEKINNKKDWVEGIREWFDDGWRVSDRKQQFIEVIVLDNIAFTRRIVTETYLGPDNETSISKAALAETLVKRNNKWLVHRVDIQTLNN